MEDSECSSGCESGWTSYLDNSFGSSPQENGKGFHSNGKCGLQSFQRTGEEEEEEDMSMVSDASSGPPPHLPEEDEMLSRQRGKKQKSKENKKPRKNSSLLDDTASSPVFNPPNKKFESEPILDVSKGYSTTQIQQGNSAYQEQYQYQYQYQQGYFQYPSPSGNYMQHNGQWFVGSTWQP